MLPARLVLISTIVLATAGCEAPMSVDAQVGRKAVVARCGSV
jgi:hypothetical protein